MANKRMNKARAAADAAAPAETATTNSPAVAATLNVPETAATSDALEESDTFNVSAAENPQLRSQFS